MSAPTAARTRACPLAPRLLCPTVDVNRMLQAAGSRQDPTGSGPDLVRLSLALAGRTRLDEMLRVALEALEAQDPGRSWAIVRRVGRREYRARSSAAVGAKDLSRLLRRACGPQSFFWSDAPRGVALMRTDPRWCALPGANDAEEGPSLVLACWSEFGAPVDGEALAQAARLIAGAARAARLVEHLLAQTSTDPLTGLLNRRGLQDTLQRELALAARHDVPLSVLFTDLDRFKKINDRHGHPVGDEVLQGVANLLSAALRGSDAIGRIGGDEFLILLPRTGIEAARAIGERLRERVAAAAFPTSAGPLSVGLSIGAASLDEAGSGDGLLERADRRMLSEKQQPHPAGDPGLAAVSAPPALTAGEP